MMSETQRKPPPEGLSKLLRERRAELGISTATLSKRSGVSQSMIKKVEMGRRSLGPETISRLAEVMGGEWRDAAFKILVDDILRVAA